MEQLKKISLNSSMVQTKKKFEESLAMSNFKNNVAPKMHAVRIANDKAENQQLIEKRLIGQLGERFQHAQLIELSRQSYLISNSVRLPIFGRKANIMERTDDNVSKKNYLLMKDGEFYANPRLLGQAGYNNPANHKYVLDPRKRELGE